MDNSETFFSYFSLKTFIVPPHENRLCEHDGSKEGSQFMFYRNLKKSFT